MARQALAPDAFPHAGLAGQFRILYLLLLQLDPGLLDRKLRPRHLDVVDLINGIGPDLIPHCLHLRHAAPILIRRVEDGDFIRVLCRIGANS